MADPLETAHAVAEQAAAIPDDAQWPVWEVFTQSQEGAPHEHAGSVHATDAEHALQNARDVYARRAAHDEGAWVREAASAYAAKQRARQASEAA